MDEHVVQTEDGRHPQHLVAKSEITSWKVYMEMKLQYTDLMEWNDRL
jgi:hypothetical protein